MENATILLIEDHLMTQDLIRIFLERYGLHVACADSGEAALILSQEKTFKIIVIDIGLPDYNGFDLIPLLKKHNPEALFLGLSAQSDKEMRKLAKEVGCAALLEKPLTEFSQVEGAPLVDYLISKSQ